jgi:hypothetical protein
MGANPKRPRTKYHDLSFKYYKDHVTTDSQIEIVPEIVVAAPPCAPSDAQMLFGYELCKASMGAGFGKAYIDKCVG